MLKACGVWSGDRISVAIKYAKVKLFHKSKHAGLSLILLFPDSLKLFCMYHAYFCKLK
jgi:hypothetical protein